MPDPYADFSSPVEDPYSSFSSPANAKPSVKESNPKEYAPDKYQKEVQAEGVSGVPFVSGRIARMGIQGLAALPLMAADAGVGVRNMLGGNYEQPSAQFNAALNQYIPEPNDLLGKAVEFVGSGMFGSRLPAPGIKEAPPSNFLKPQQSLKMQSLQKGRDAGLVALPSNTNPTLGNRLLEGISGKLKLQQESTIKNAPKFDAMQARALGLNEDVPVTRGALDQIRKEAYSKGYEPIKKVGEMVSDEKYLTELSSLTQAAKGAERSFKGLVKDNDLGALVESLSQDKFSSEDAVDAIKILREYADDAYRGGKGSLGKAYKSAAKSLEDVIERNLQGMGKNGQELLKNYRDSRTLIAQSHTAEKAMANEYGGVDALKMGGELRKGKPLQGEQRTMAEFARNFPKSSRFVSESFPAISPMDEYASMIAAGSLDSAVPLAYPLTRVGLREYLLSQRGQARGLPKAFKPKDNLGGYAFLPSGWEGLKDLLSE